MDWPGYRGQRVKWGARFDSRRARNKWLHGERDAMDGWLYVNVRREKKNTFAYPLSINDMMHSKQLARGCPVERRINW